MYHQCDFEHLGSGLAYLLLAVFVLKESVVPSILLVVLFSPSSSVVTPSSLAPKSVKIVSCNKHRNSCVCPGVGGGASRIARISCWNMNKTSCTQQTDFNKYCQLSVMNISFVQLVFVLSVLTNAQFTFSFQNVHQCTYSIPVNGTMITEKV
jgi:hypothetical protein